jgi:hypothetical protein
VFAIGFFDPRFGLLALPLFLLYNRENLRKAVLSFAIALVLSNFILLYPGTVADFFLMVFSSGLTTPLYFYTLIPFLTLLSLIFVNIKEISGLLAFTEKLRKLITNRNRK